MPANNEPKKTKRNKQTSDQHESNSLNMILDSLASVGAILGFSMQIVLRGLLCVIYFLYLVVVFVTDGLSKQLGLRNPEVEQMEIKAEQLRQRPKSRQSQS